MCRTHVVKRPFSRFFAPKMTRETKIRVYFIKDLKLLCCTAKRCLSFHTLLFQAELLLKKIPLKTDSLKLWKSISELPMASCIYSLPCCRPTALSPSKGIQWELWLTCTDNQLITSFATTAWACRPSLCW